MFQGYIPQALNTSDPDVQTSAMHAALSTKQDAAAFLDTLVSIGGTSGSGNLARVTSPTFVTPVLGAATGTSFRSSAGGAGINTVANGSRLSLYSNNTESVYLDGVNVALSSSGAILIGSGGATSGTYDSSISRQSSGVVQIGTTAANALGSLACANVTASGQVFCSGFGPNSSTNYLLFSAGTTFVDGTGGLAYRDSSAGYAQRVAVSNSGNVTASGTVKIGSATEYAQIEHLGVSGTYIGSMQTGGTKRSTVIHGSSLNFNCGTTGYGTTALQLDGSGNLTATGSATFSGNLNLPNTHYSTAATKQTVGASDYWGAVRFAATRNVALDSASNENIAQIWAYNGFRVSYHAGNWVTTSTPLSLTNGDLTVPGTGTHTFGTTNTVTMAAGNLTATGMVLGSSLRVGNSNGQIDLSSTTINFSNCTAIRVGSTLTLKTTGAFRNSTDSADADISAAKITASGATVLGTKTIATLPSAASSNTHRYQVTDSPTVANRIAFSNGSAWYYEGTAVAV